MCSLSCLALRINRWHIAGADRRCDIKETYFVLPQQNVPIQTGRPTFLPKNKFMLQKDVDGREVKADSLKNIRVCQGSRETKSKKR